MYRDLKDYSEAIKYCEKVIALAPEEAAPYLNLGAVYESQADYDRAAHAYQHALKLEPSHPKALNNLGKLCHLQGKTAEAVTYLKRALAVEPNYPLALNNLGVLLSDTGKKQDALTYLEKSYQLDPHNISTMYNLAGLYNSRNESEKAIAMLENVIETDPDHDPAHHMLAAIRGIQTETAPHQYVQEVFDRYAPRFDSHLQDSLGYTAPFGLAKLVKAHLPERTFTSALDLGCGTGLSGEAFQEFSSRLTGIDLSAEMLARAGAKNIYTELHCTDILTFLRETTEDYDLFISADVFIYLGAVDSFFKLVAQKAASGGVVACSIERDNSVEDFSLRSSGRYAHNPIYLEETAGKYGFSLLINQDHNLRKEERQWIKGDLYLFQFSH
ncbi:MAG: tetratricopeptide repeat protein [Desulfobulbaceae bacterium]|nr:MAG: tetratricopeptide repeat protein [Desulfobulbaceae bacterium]